MNAELVRRIYRNILRRREASSQDIHNLRTSAFELLAIVRRRHEYQDTMLTDTQEAEIARLWSSSGLRYERYRRWFRLYYASSGIFDPQTFPEILFSTKLEPLLNGVSQARNLADKSLAELLFSGVPGVAVPATRLIRARELFYGGDREVLSSQAARALLGVAGEVFIKPSVGSSSGRDVLFCDFRNGVDIRSGESVDQILSSYAVDFIAQDRVIQHFDFGRPHPESLNTIRLVTYVLNGNVYHWPVVFRMGAGSASVDNAHAGGVYMGVRDNGELLDFALDMTGRRYYNHPTTDLAFSGYRLPSISRLIRLGKLLHGRLPGQGIVSWDFAVRSDGMPVIIEVNLSGQSIWLPQLSHGIGAFGNETSQMLALIGRPRRSRRKTAEDFTVRGDS